MGVLIITHYQRILHMVKPQFVHIMFEGRIVKEGGPELVTELEKHGYGWIRDEVAAAALMSLAVPTSAEFPILAREGLVYLDTAATAQTVRPALEAMDRYYETYRASIHRGIYAIAAEATDAYEARARQGRRVHELDARRDGLHAQRDRGHQPRRQRVGPRERRRRTTSWCSRRWSTTRTSSRGSCSAARLAYVPVTDDGLLDLDVLDELLAQGPKLVAVAHVSNVLGTINPIAEIVERAHAAGALVLVDGAQAVPSLPVDVAELGADFYAWTGHKAYGPTGIGVLHGRRELLEAMPPFLGGGHMIARVGDFESTWAEPPAKFEAGTMPVAEAIGLGAAVDWLAETGMDAVREHGRDVTALRARAPRRGRRA